MHTIITQNIDGYEVITDVSQSLIDAEKTRPIVNEFMNKSDVNKKIEACKKEIMDHAKAAAISKKAARDAKEKGQKQQSDNHAADYRLRNEKINEIMETMKPLAKQFIDEQKKATEKLAVYHTPKPGEKTVTNGIEVLEKLRDAYANDELLLSDLATVKDYRGKRFFKKVAGSWIVQEISKLGEEPISGGKEQLTEDEIKELQEQIDDERIKKLPEKDKEKEKNVVIDNLAGQAAAMRSKLEIQGDSQALKKSQDWYKAEVEKVNVKYS